LNWKLRGKLSTKPENEVILEAKDCLLDGSVVELGTSQKTGANFAAVGFVNDKVNLKFKVESPTTAGKPLNFLCDGVYQWSRNVFFGANALFTKHEKKQDEESALDYNFNFKCHFGFPYSSTTLLFNKQKDDKKNQWDQLGLIWTQTLSDRVKFATKFTMDTNLNIDPTLEAAFEKRVDDDTLMKSKLHFSSLSGDKKKFRLAFAYQTKVSKMCTLTVGADVNALELSGSKGGDGHSLGLEVKFK